MISIVINCDTRLGSEQDQSIEGTMFNGTRSYDFLTEGVLNKVNFFRGHPIEVILFIDIHQEVPKEIQDVWKTIPNLTICMNKHREYFNDQLYSKWNDHNYLQALYLARGNYIAHFDQDSVCFRKDNCEVVSKWIDFLNKKTYDFISYPSRWSPNPDCGEWNYWWVSTRFFFCQRSSLDFTEIEKCLRDSNYLYSKYFPDSEPYRRCPWTEHILGIIAGPSKVFYPPIELDDYTIFSWNKYTQGTLKNLNNMSYNEVRRFILDRGGISWPCDVSC